MRQTEDDKDPDKKFDQRPAIVFYKYRDILDGSYHFFLSESGDMENLIQFAPGFIVVKNFTFIQHIVKVLDVHGLSLLDLSKRNRRFVSLLNHSGHASPEVMFNIHFREFLSDRNRSIGHYQDPITHHLAVYLKGYNITS